MMKLLSAMAAVVIVASALGCSDAPPEWHQESGHRWRELRVARGAAEGGFTAMTRGATGIDFQNVVSDSLLLGNRILAQGAGVALGDVDGDGLADIFLARTEGCSALYRNMGGFRFEDVTTTSGVGACDRHSTGSTFADVDGDTDLDLLLLATRGPNAIFVNDGAGKFTERRDLGLDTTGSGGSTLTMADVDGDGGLDLYVANYKPYFLDDSIPPQQRAFNQMVREVAKGRYEIVPEFRSEYKLVMRPDMGGLRMSMRGAPDEFYRNVGGRFTKVEMTERFRAPAGSEVEESFTLSARFADLNGDGAPDLYVTNDFEDLDKLWYNDGAGSFRLADWSAQRQVSNSSMGMDVGDINGDGLPDLFVDDMLSNDTRRLKTQIPTHTALPKRPADFETPLQQQRNVLFLNRGDGTFAEIAQYAGVGASGWSWGAMFMDVDLDGRLDLLVANGNLWDIMDADAQEGLQNRLSDVPWQRTRWEFPSLALRNVAFRNRGDLTFEDASARWKFGTEDDISHAMASADLDGDGDLDVVVNRLRSPALVLRNDASAARVAVRLVGAAPNTHAVGATVRLLGGAQPVQEREVTAGGLYMSHSDYLATFAMGKSDSATLVVDWRDGRRTTMAVKPNRIYEVTPTTAGPRPAIAGADTAPLFEDVTAQLGGHRHVEDKFDDWDRQYLLPDALSMMGPGVSWFDYDRDGREDLAVGAGKGGRIALFRNEGGRLAPQRAQGPVAAQDFTSLLGIADAAGVRMLAGVSTWQLRSESERIAQPAVVTVGLSRGGLASSASHAVGSHAAATGPLALADYDGDGALDLFVGSRAMPMNYPAPPSSGLFRNVAGTFVLDSANMGVLRGIGMVSSAIFADVNGDGRDDLLLARDWGSIVLLLNDGHGRFTDAPSWGLGRWTSRWNGIAAGDLDGDGRLDLVATSWGRNTATPADSAHPLVMLFGPFGAAGEMEMVLARDDARVKGLAPINSYARVRVAYPDLVSRLSTFASYADATVDQVFGPAVNRVLRASVVSLEHMAFMNRGDRFEAVALPAEAQLAPAFHASIADFDGNGTEDVFLAQNFSPTAVGYPRYDSGRGLLLTGDGKGAFVPMSGARSGIVVYGDQRGAGHADFDGDGRLDLAVSQNGAATRLFRNRSAEKGLRVRLDGPPSNPDGIGAQVRLVYGDRMGPVRQVQAGSGYWSQNGAVQVFGMTTTPTAVWVRWGRGAEVRVPVPSGAAEVRVPYRTP